MRLAAVLPAALVLAACGGKDKDSQGPTASCDDYVTTPMTSLTPDQFPEGLDAGIEALRNLDGLWRGSHCLETGRTIDVKVTAMPVIPDEVEVVQQAPDPKVQCGCGADPFYAHDNALDVVGLLPAFTMSVIPQEVAPIDVAVDNREFQMSGALFAGTQGLYFRACDTYQVEPYLNSQYDTVAANLRIQTKAEQTPLAHLGQVTLSLALIQQVQGSTPLECDVMDLEKVQ